MQTVANYSSCPPPAMFGGHYTQPSIQSQQYRFALQVVQQPIRARMCGFGDKDRRQITPPPCVRLRIFDAATGVEIRDVSGIEISLFALCVELWSVDESQNLSLVHPNGHPSGPSNEFPPSYARASGMVRSPAATPTRNLIGSLVATAFKLYDLDEELGIWFVLQDLSIRTEGEFKLRFSFVNLADSFSGQPAPILCSAFSDPFKSYSAKKFPGVIDSTSLSRCFAVQGIKIPIRRDHKSKKGSS
ncbi:hypothetical protein TRVA0_030S01024 [Trichomonascus vanleenenianus]|uniref:velvet factor family protein n=1 Tax=Trichomonascus vanleenenianus TaxID=2268995 RepID=UPI003ECA0AB8